MNDANSGDSRGNGQATKDPLTGLDLRRAFVGTVSGSVAGLAARAAKGTLIYVDVDGLRSVNRSAGRARGDEVLVTVSKAIAEALGDKTVLARDSGDAFAAFVAEMEPPFTAMAAEEVRARCSRALARADPPPTVSVGFALFPDEGAGAVTLLANARRAARSAREAGGDRTASVSSLGPLEGPELVLDGLPCPDFIGREEEMQTLRERLESCRRGGGYLFVRGEPGVGKTRMLREFRRAAEVSMAAAGFAACRPTDPGSHFAALARAFTDLAGPTPEKRKTLLEGRSPQEAEELAPLFERSGVPLVPAGTVRSAPERTAEERRRILFRGLTGMLESLALGGMVVLLFDDAAWLDAGSVDVLRSVAARESFGFLAVAAASERSLRDEGGRLRPAAELFETPGPGLTAWEMPLRRLPIAEAAAMTSSILDGRPTDDALDQALFGVSAGNPLFHEGLLRWLAIHRAVEGNGATLRLSFDRDSAPKTLEALLDATISALPGELAEAGQAAAAVGGPVSAAALALALGRSEAEVTGFIDWLLRLGLFGPVSAGSDEVAPAGARTAERILAAAEPDVLEVVHSAYADLAARRSAAGRASAAEEAYHRGFTSDTAAATLALARAEEEAARLWVADEAGLAESAGAGAHPVRGKTEAIRPPPSSGRRTAGSVRKARFETTAAPALASLAGESGKERVSAPDADAPPAPAPAGVESDAPSRSEERGLERLGPARVLTVEGIPDGSDPIRLATDDAEARLLAALDRLLDDNERPTAAALIWRTLAGFEQEDTQGRRRLATFLAELEPRIWRTRLVESYKAIEDTLGRELKIEEEPETLELFARSAARAMYAFLRAGHHSRVEKLGARLMRRPPEIRKAALDELSSTDFFDLILSDLGSESAERANGALAVLRHIAGAVEGGTAR
ncbi:MAG: AAA family ATPase [Planctomycetota bacterium]